MTIEQKNNAIVAYLGGPVPCRKQLGHHNDAEFDFVELSDLKFHSSFDWLIPAWSKVRHEMTPGMIIAAITFIDEANIDGLFKLISQVCIDWCKTKNLKL